MNTKAIHEQFQNPGTAYRGKPFWSWNGELQKDELIRQAKVLGEMGFGGHFMHSRCGLITEYLGEEWFDLINAVTDASEEAGLEAWLYDEDRWPSGSAGGKATEDPKYRMKALYVYEIAPDRFHWDDDIFCAFAARIGADGLRLDAYQRIESEKDLPEAFCALSAKMDEAAAQAASDAADKVLCFKVVLDPPNSNYNGNTYLNTMNREAVDHFIELTHEEYVKHCGDRVGRTIQGVFTDEPHRGFAMNNYSEADGIHSSSMFYTDDIFDEFQLRYGYDAAALLPELFYRLHGEPISKVRIDYFDLGCNLFNERFTQPVAEWCRDHNMLFTGHVLHEDMLASQAIPNGSLMRFYQYMDHPGIDLLGSNNLNYWVAKQCSSICRQFDRKWMLSEMYGCSGWEFPLRSHKILGDWQALFGVNVRCPHLSWYTMEGECKRDYPASISFQSPYWKDYAFVESYFARLGLILSEGRPVCDLLVLSPIESVWGIAHLKWASWVSPLCDDELAIEKIYADTFKTLAGARIDFDYGEEQIMAENYRIDCDDQGAVLHIGSGCYRTLLISGALTIRESTLQIAREFLQAGGRVVFCGELPSYVGGLPSSACAELLASYENATRSELNTLAADLSGLNPIYASADEQVFSQIRKDGDDYISVWLNTSNDSAKDFTISTLLPASYRAELWNPETGERLLYPTYILDGYVTADVTLKPVGSLVLLFTQDTAELPLFETAAVRQENLLTTGEFAYTLDEPNVMVLDYARYRFEQDETFSDLGEALKIDQAIRDRIGIEHRGGEMLQPWFAKKFDQSTYGKVVLEYPFRVEVLPDGPIYLAGERPKLQEYYCNGVRLTAPDLSDWWVDNAFVKMEVPASALHLGENVISIVTEFKRTTNVEAVYLIGDFGVKAAAGASAMVSLPETLGLDPIVDHALPFYSGRVTLHVTPEQYAPYVDASFDRILLQVSEYDAPLVSVQVGDDAVPLPWEPYTVDVTSAVRNGETLHITLVNSRRNSFGPLHIVPKLRPSYGPPSFLTTGSQWSDEYSLIPSQVGPLKFLNC